MYRPKPILSKTTKKPRFKSVDEFNIIEEIGKGGYSVVYLVENKKTGRKYALKCAMRFKKDKDRSQRTYIEIQVLRKLKHPNVIQLKGWFEDDDTIYLVLEYLPGKDCSKFFKHKLPTKLQVINIIRQLVEAIMYIHEKGIIHRDIKLENLLIDDDFNVKLTDFGLCAIKESEYDMLQDSVGTVRYTSPELLRGEGYNESVDIWAIGVILFMLLTGTYPFDGKHKESIFNRIKMKDIHYSKYELEKKEKKILQLLLEKNPDKRIEIEDILDQSFFGN
jgi:serine/threonine protein kinase